MSTYKMDDGTVVNTDNATESWDEAQSWDGNNHISVATGSQWSHERLHRSRKGRYYTEHWSNYQGSREYVEWVSNRQAVVWLITNGHDLPEELEALRGEVEE